MKMYTLRMDDELLTSLKAIGLKERKSLRAIMIEALQEKIHKQVPKSQSLKERKIFERAACLAKRLSKEELLAAIREDRSR